MNLQKIVEEWVPGVSLIIGTINRVNEFVFSLLDAYLMPRLSLSVWLPPGSQLLLVVKMSSYFSREKVLVALSEMVFGKSTKKGEERGGGLLGLWKALMFIGLGLGLFLGVLVPGLRSGLAIRSNPSLMMRLGELSFFDPATLLLGVLGGILLNGLVTSGLGAYMSLRLWFTYIQFEWQRRHYRVAIWNTMMYLGGPRLIGTPQLASSATARLTEARLESPGERMGQEAPTLIGRLWDEFLFIQEGMMDVFLPIREVFEGADRLPYQPNADRLVGILLRSAEESRGELEPLLNAMRGEIAKARLTLAEVKPEFYGEEVVTAEAEVADLRRKAMSQIAAIMDVPEDVREVFITASTSGIGFWVDLREQEDPGIWDTSRGIKVAEAATD